MKSFVMKLVTFFLLFGLVPCAYAGEYLYFRGYISQDQCENSDSNINAWNLHTGELTSLSFTGYLIESGEGEVWAVVGEHSDCEVELALLSEGMVQKTVRFALPEKAVRIMAYKEGWLYYITVGNESQGCIYRISADGNLQSYNIGDYISGYISLCTMPFSFSKDGYLAFLYDASDDTSFVTKFSLGLSQPDGKTISVGETGGTVLAWLDKHRLLYSTFDNVLYVCNMQDKTLSPYLAEASQTISLNLPQTNISVSSDGKWLAYQTYAPPKLFGFLPPVDTNWNPLVICSLENGETRLSQPVLISTELSYSYCPQLRFE